MAIELFDKLRERIRFETQDDGTYWSDEELDAYINEAQRDFCERTRCLRAEAPITASENLSTFTFPEDLLRLLRATNSDGTPLAIKRYDEVEDIAGGNITDADNTGTPQYLYVGLDGPEQFRLYPIPESSPVASGTTFSPTWVEITDETDSCLGLHYVDGYVFGVYDDRQIIYNVQEDTLTEAGTSAATVAYPYGDALYFGVDSSSNIYKLNEDGISLAADTEYAIGGGSATGLIFGKDYAYITTFGGAEWLVDLNSAGYFTGLGEPTALYCSSLLGNGNGGATLIAGSFESEKVYLYNSGAIYYGEYGNASETFASALSVAPGAAPTEAVCDNDGNLYWIGPTGASEGVLFKNASTLATRSNAFTALYLDGNEVLYVAMEDTATLPTGTLYEIGKTSGDATETGTMPGLGNVEKIAVANYSSIAVASDADANGLFLLGDEDQGAISFVQSSEETVSANQERGVVVDINSTTEDIIVSREEGVVVGVYDVDDVAYLWYARYPREDLLEVQKDAWNALVYYALGKSYAKESDAKHLAKASAYMQSYSSEVNRLYSRQLRALRPRAQFF